MKPKSKPAAARPKPRFSGAAITSLGLALVAGLGFWSWTRSQTNGPAPAVSPVETNPASASVVTSATRLVFQKLNGRWLRPDGGYVLEIKAADDNSGKLEAAYFNPQPINVSKAEASGEGSALKVFIELRAPNYPGSTYTLAYNRATDQLQGIYYQAALQQQFEVFFERSK